MRKPAFISLIIVLLTVSMLALACSSPAPKPSPSPAPAPTSSPAPKPSPSPSPSPSPTASPKPTTINLSFGSTTSTSGTYTWPVAIARVVNKNVPGINITVVESGATYDNLRKVKDGVFDGGFADGWAGVFEMYHGQETFNGNAWNQVRVLLMRDQTVLRTVARADSGIKTWSDLKGKKVSPGIPGSSQATLVKRVNDLLGTGAEVIPDTLENALRDLKTGKIDAAGKAGTVFALDASLMEVHRSTPLNVIGFTKEEAAKISAKYPSYFATETPAGAIKELPQLGSIYELYSMGLGDVSTRMPQDVGYRIVKAIYEHRSDIDIAYPPSALYNPIGDFISIMSKAVPANMIVPLHAGSVQYAKEIGINVPPAFIPPEYKP
ncbi:MAG: TAXI family TRAP transporter solute-binding subunit [Dehalococcoidales bacterium]|nr:TAXI family TRAP transporter solute-binding subunit [Dehalococcoidales bacterium]